MVSKAVLAPRCCRVVPGRFPRLPPPLSPVPPPTPTAPYQTPYVGCRCSTSDRQQASRPVQPRQAPDAQDVCIRELSIYVSDGCLHLGVASNHRVYPDASSLGVLEASKPVHPNASSLSLLEARRRLQAKPDASVPIGVLVIRCPLGPADHPFKAMDSALKPSPKLKPPAGPLSMSLCAELWCQRASRDGVLGHTGVPCTCACSRALGA